MRDFILKIATQVYEDQQNLFDDAAKDLSSSIAYSEFDLRARSQLRFNQFYLRIIDTLKEHEIDLNRFCTAVHSDLNLNEKFNANLRLKTFLEKAASYPKSFFIDMVVQHIYVMRKNWWNNANGRQEEFNKIVTAKLSEYDLTVTDIINSATAKRIFVSSSVLAPFLTATMPPLEEEASSSSISTNSEKTLVLQVAEDLYNKRTQIVLVALTTASTANKVESKQILKETITRHLNKHGLTVADLENDANAKATFLKAPKFSCVFEVLPPLTSETQDKIDHLNQVNIGDYTEAYAALKLRR